MTNREGWHAVDLIYQKFQFDTYISNNNKRDIQYQRHNFWGMFKQNGKLQIIRGILEVY